MLIRINEISTIGEALFCLGGLTKRPWTEAEFAREVIRLRLPIYAMAPAGAKIVRREHIDGKQVVTPQPDLPAMYVTLLQHEIEQLALGGQTITDRPAWVFGDEPYCAWSEIEAHRAANHRVASIWDEDPGEWMGESDLFFFADPIGVTPDTTLVVPRHTIAEIALEAAKHCGEQKSRAPLDDASARHDGHMAVAGAQGRHQARDNTDRIVKKKHTWDNHALRRLREESMMPGATQFTLAEKYGISRQGIAKQLARAKEKFGLKKANAFDSLNLRGKK